MRILFVVTRADVIGGASMHVVHLAKQLKAKGHQVLILFGGRKSGRITELCQQQLIDYQLLPSLVREISVFDDVKAVLQLNKLVRAFQPDMVHLHSSKAALLGRLAAKLAGYNAVVTIHGWPFIHANNAFSAWCYRGLEKLMAPLTSRYICVTEVDRIVALEQLQLHPSKVITIHNGIEEAEQFKPQLNLEVNQLCVLIVVARFEHPKDHESLIIALDGLQHLKWQLRLIGDGLNLASIRTLVEQRQLQGRVEFLGECNNVPVQLAKADALVLLSDYESLPLSIIEAMRAGLPVIATDTGGVSELVADKVTGLLVARKDINAIERALEQLITSPELRRMYGHAAYKKFIQCFTAEQMADRTLKCYQAVIKGIA